MVTQSYLFWLGAYLAWWHLFGETQSSGWPRKVPESLNLDIPLWLSAVRQSQSSFEVSAPQTFCLLSYVSPFQIKWPCCVWGNGSSTPLNTSVRYVTSDTRSSVLSGWGNTVSISLIFQSLGLIFWVVLCVQFVFLFRRRCLFPVCTTVYSTSLELPLYTSIFTCRAVFSVFLFYSASLTLIWASWMGYLQTCSHRSWWLKWYQRCMMRMQISVVWNNWICCYLSSKP